MEWIECSIYTTSEALEVVSAMLLENGINGFQIEDYKDMINFLNSNSTQWDYLDDDIINNNNETNIKFYVSQNVYGKEIITRIKSELERLKNLGLELDLGNLKLVIKDVDEKDWIDNWKKYYKPFKIGEKILIKPEWENVDNPDNRIIFNINPGHVFGTGLHQTTQLCIEQLEKYVTEDSKVLDLGCGTGILSVISLMLGASKAFAIDIEPNAIKVAYDNADLNNVDKSKYTVVSGNILSDTQIKNKILNENYNIVVSNIVADVIIGLSDFAYEALDNNGIFIASGIIKERLDEVYKKLNDSNFSILNTFYKDDWVCVVSTKNRGIL